MPELFWKGCKLTALKPYTLAPVIRQEAGAAGAVCDATVPFGLAGAYVRYFVKLDLEVVGKRS